MGATGLAANPTEYRDRLREQSDAQLDAWAAELMRDVAARRGVVKVVADVQKTARLDERTFRRVFARGGGARRSLARTPRGTSSFRPSPFTSWFPGYGPRCRTLGTA